MTKILDCTIRDGGHLTEWNFSDDLVSETLLAAKNSGVDFFEIGYLNGVGGKFAQCCENLLEIIACKGDVKIAAMINAGGNVHNLPDKNIIDCIRVACHPHETEIGIQLCQELKEKGFEVFLHLMNISGMDEKHFKILSDWKNKKILTSVYFADSFGSLVTSNIKKYFELLRGLDFANISFHGHNNMQMAFANSLAAIDCGAYSIDVSAYGMGRGSGNLPAEILIGYLKRNPQFYFELIEKYYIELFEKYRWGYSVPNLIGGFKNLHPKELKEFSGYEYSEMWQKSDV